MSTGTLAMRRPIASPPAVPAPVVSNVRLAIIVIIAAESMFFVGLIGTYLVFRLAARQWPPGDLPRLPVALTALNSVVLWASILPMARALRAVRRDDLATLNRTLVQTAVLGVTFLAVQGGEWVRLVRHGLTLGGSMYGATFYVLIGCHAVHVLAAVVWLAVTALVARTGRFTAERHGALEMCGLYWYFVCALWMVLFPLVYLY